VDRVVRILTVLLWTLAAAGLFFGFGLVCGSAIVRTLAFARVLRPDLIVPAVYLVQAGLGLGMLGLSWIYRHKGGDNAGSLAAWLSGWGLMLYALGLLVARTEPGLVPLLLGLVLLAWLARRLARVLSGEHSRS